jgi:hypothetical protein
LLQIAPRHLGEATGDAVWLSRVQALASAMAARFIKPNGALIDEVALYLYMNLNSWTASLFTTQRAP